MKKFVSSILVFTMMGIPMASNVFAAGNEAQENLAKSTEAIVSLITEAKQKENISLADSLASDQINKILSSSSEEADKSKCIRAILRVVDSEESTEEIINVIKAAKDAGNEDLARELANEHINKIMNSPNKTEGEKTKEIVDIYSVVDNYRPEVNREEENEEVAESEEDEEAATKQNFIDSEKGSYSTAKKALIATSVLAAMAAAGYFSYTYCPAVKEFVDHSILPFANSCLDQVKTAGSNVSGKISELGSKAKAAVGNFFSMIKGKFVGKSAEKAAQSIPSNITKVVDKCPATGRDLIKEAIKKVGSNVAQSKSTALVPYEGMRVLGSNAGSALVPSPKSIGTTLVPYEGMQALSFNVGSALVPCASRSISTAVAQYANPVGLVPENSGALAPYSSVTAIAPVIQSAAQVIHKNIGGTLFDKVKANAPHRQLVPVKKIMATSVISTGKIFGKSAEQVAQSIPSNIKQQEKFKSTLLDAFVGKFKGAWKATKNVVSKVFNFIKKPFVTPVDTRKHGYIKY